MNESGGRLVILMVAVFLLFVVLLAFHHDVFGAVTTKQIFGDEYNGGQAAEGCHVVVSIVKVGGSVVDTIPHDTAGNATFAWDVEFPSSDTSATSNSSGRWRVHVPLTSNTVPSYDRIKLTCYNPGNEGGKPRWEVVLDSLGVDLVTDTVTNSLTNILYKTGNP